MSEHKHTCESQIPAICMRLRYCVCACGAITRFPQWSQDGVWEMPVDATADSTPTEGEKK